MTVAPQCTFSKLYWARAAEGKAVCQGLDSDPALLPLHLRDPDQSVWGTAQLALNTAIVEATRDIVCAYKPNLKSYRGDVGKRVLQETIHMILDLAPGVPVILDAKWGDIGNSNNGYIEELAWYGAHAVTLNPYVGKEGGIEPFLQQDDLCCFFLAKTSNPGAGELQDQLVLVPREVGSEPGMSHVREQGLYLTPFYRTVVYQISRDWNDTDKGNCGVVAGATHPEDVAKVRQIVGDKIPILNPVVGAQGADLVDTVKAGVNSEGQGLIINLSRGSLFASDGEDYAGACRNVVQQTQHNVTAALAA
jgi:orotidine-5'-phosphate decarboxylase